MLTRCGSLASRSSRWSTSVSRQYLASALQLQAYEGPVLQRPGASSRLRHMTSTSRSSQHAESAKAPSSAKAPGSIASVFASLSGGKPPALPDRFLALKQGIVQSRDHAEALTAAWNEVLLDLEQATQEAATRGANLIPQVQYPGDAVAEKSSVHDWMGKDAVEALRKRGTVIVKGVVPRERALAWKDDIRAYIGKNPHTRGFPEDNLQVFELYWSKAQLAARGDRSFLNASRAVLSLWKAPLSADTPIERSMSTDHLLTYCDRLRIRLPGDATFALGPHIDGGGVERWEDPTFRACWSSILMPAGNERRIDWQSHDSWSIGKNGERLGANTDMYDAAGACSVFRPLQGWLSMSSTGPGEGTLRVLPFITAATAYIILRPFFRPRQSFESLGFDEVRYLAPENWRFDVSDAQFDGCTLGKNIELSPVSHPHLRLDRTMVSIPRVEPGDVAFWHCDVVHAVEAQHNGAPGKDSSVLYIPAIPLTANNFKYIQEQRGAFEHNIPPPDFPGGEGEARHVGRGRPSDIESLTAGRAMGLESFEASDQTPAAQRKLIDACNAKLA